MRVTTRKQQCQNNKGVNTPQRLRERLLQQPGEGHGAVRGNGAAELETFGDAKGQGTSRCADGQRHELKAVPPYLTQEPRPTLYKPEVPGARLRILPGGTALVSLDSHIQCQVLDSNHQIASWTPKKKKKKSASPFGALKRSSPSLTPQHWEICRTTLTPSLAPEACTSLYLEDAQCFC